MNYEALLDSFYVSLETSINQLILYLEGEPGVGKTSLFKNFCRDKGLPLTIMNLSAAESSDLTGVPFQENGITYYGKPSFLDQYDGIIFFDEINRITDSDVKSALLSLFVDRSINGHKLSNNVLIVCAGNKAADDQEVNELDRAMLSRLVKVEFKRSFEEWMAYMKRTHKRSPMLDFYESHRDALKVFDYRRLEYTLNFLTSDPNNSQYIGYFLSPSVQSLYYKYIKGSLFSFEDLKSGVVPIKLDSASEKKLMNDLQFWIESGETMGTDEGANVNSFLLGARAENLKSLFVEITRITREHPEFEKLKAIWTETGIFKGLGDYLQAHLGL